MSNLITRFEEDLQLAGYAKRSRQSYVSSVHRLQRFLQKPLEDITEEDLRQYWLVCKSDFGWSSATLRISYSGIKHFFTRTLVRPWPILNEIRFKRDETLPTILSRQEVRQIIGALPTLQSSTFYITLYSLGLRLLEALTLQVPEYPQRSRPRSCLRRQGLYGPRRSSSRHLPHYAPCLLCYPPESAMALPGSRPQQR